MTNFEKNLRLIIWIMLLTSKNTGYDLKLKLKVRKVNTINNKKNVFQLNKVMK